MRFALDYSEAAKEQLREIKNTPHLEKRYKAVTKALKFLAENPKHPGLQTHAYTSFEGPQGQKIFEAYAEQNTPAAFRIFFYYGNTQGVLVIVAITPHP